MNGVMKHTHLDSTSVYPFNHEMTQAFIMVIAIYFIGQWLHHVSCLRPSHMTTDA